MPQPPSPARDAVAAQRDPAQLAAETAALRRQAAEILRRSRWYRDDCLRELLLERRWHGASEGPHGPAA
jgi:hypothetical protein